MAAAAIKPPDRRTRARRASRSGVCYSPTGLWRRFTRGIRKNKESILRRFTRTAAEHTTTAMPENSPPRPPQPQHKPYPASEEAGELPTQRERKQ
ncbi:hypothetical protein EYF80_011726 [Liparis tanakae]|uniref:Uncharacterized protein n=1 Tax=Liparis tanakae TaxID=230148 RepID=A0A4Z2ILB7_9TELE|nr:hypothetical protein EYF80_011726 [Liparis tanakae]